MVNFDLVLQYNHKETVLFRVVQTSGRIEVWEEDKSTLQHKIRTVLNVQSHHRSTASSNDMVCFFVGSRLSLLYWVECRPHPLHVKGLMAAVLLIHERG